MTYSVAKLRILALIKKSVEFWGRKSRSKMIRCGLGEEPRLHARRPTWKLSHSSDERKWGFRPRRKPQR